MSLAVAHSDDTARLTHQSAADAEERLEAAGKLISDKALKSFFDALFSHAAPDDVNRYTPQALVALARLVFARVSGHRTGDSSVALFTARDEDAAYGENDTLMVAINDDMPFLFDSFIAEATEGGGRVRAVFHPIIQFAAQPVSVIVLVLEPIVSEATRHALLHGAKSTFAQVRVAVGDWRAMLERAKQATEELRQRPPKVSAEELSENIAFLEWLGNNHFTFLGARDYRFDPKGEGALEPVAESGLGVLADSEARVIRRGPDRSAITPQVRAFLTQPSPLIITKSNERSLVHRRVHMD